MPPEALLALRERHRVESLPADLDAIRRWYECLARRSSPPDSRRSDNPVRDRSTSVVSRVP
jgi:hypothetical protein